MDIRYSQETYPCHFPIHLLAKRRQGLNRPEIIKPLLEQKKTFFREKRLPSPETS
ncbi:hypothetical protein TCARB_0126 [Thermofilum adornatum 1505]|uniref:Uncharacterized protein n=1 Tax=Thermofilum adornatum 1505 TaxID=697581 RepID=A0A3G1A7D0_9CREN|nr:hypothetical protein TCARB_0126 [Thermofilum adornatum 1505]